MEKIAPIPLHLSAVGQSPWCASYHADLRFVYREQERILKAEQARQETERILRDQQAEVDKKKSDMIRRDIAREEVKSRKQIEVAAKNAEAQAKADARIAAALDAGRQMLQKRREEFDSKQRLNEQRRQYVPTCPTCIGLQFLGPAGHKAACIV